VVLQVYPILAQLDRWIASGNRAFLCGLAGEVRGVCVCVCVCVSACVCVCCLSAYSPPPQLYVLHMVSLPLVAIYTLLCGVLFSVV
jgi:hypothetical protein